MKSIHTTVKIDPCTMLEVDCGCMQAITESWFIYERCDIYVRDICDRWTLTTAAISPFRSSSRGSATESSRTTPLTPTRLRDQRVPRVPRELQLGAVFVLEKKMVKNKHLKHGTEVITDMWNAALSRARPGVRTQEEGDTRG